MIHIDRIKDHFSDEDAIFVRKMLATYSGDEQDRVQVAILELAQGSVDGIKYHVECAQKDYRDILYWAKYTKEEEVSFRKQFAGMTVNERLFHLNLFDAYDSAVAERDEFKLKEILKKCLLGDDNIDAIIKSKI